MRVIVAWTAEPPPVVTVTTTDPAAPQLPAASRPGTYRGWYPGGWAPMSTPAVTFSSGEFRAPSTADISVPAPLAPSVSMKYSAAAMLELPVAVSLTLAVRVTNPPPPAAAATLLVTGP